MVGLEGRQWPNGREERSQGYAGGEAGRVRRKLTLKEASPDSRPRQVIRQEFIYPFH